MAIDRTYVFSDKTTVTLRPISPLTLQHITSMEAGKPAIPMVEVVIAGKKQKAQANPNDPDYLAALTAWEQEKQKRTLIFIATKGVAEDPPKASMDEYLAYMPDAKQIDLKYMWVTEHLHDQDEITAFLNAALGQTVATEEGIAEAAAAFPGDSQPGTDSGLVLESSPNGRDRVELGV